MKKLYLLLFFTTVAIAQSPPPGFASYDTYICESNTDGFATFDLSTVIPQILGNLDPASYSVNFYLNSFSDIANPVPLTYTNIVQYDQVIWVSVKNIATNAPSLRTGSLSLHVVDYPSANTAPDLVIYENEIGIKLLAQAVIIAGGQPDVKITFYNTEADALSNINQVNPMCMPNNLSSATTTVWALVKNSISGCAVTTNFNLQLISGTNPILSPAIAFTDLNFKSKLLQSNATEEIAFDVCGNKIKIDSNDDGEIQQDEARFVSKLVIDGASITSIQGIGYFLNLTSLSCRNNQLTELNVTALNQLKSVDCSHNLLTVLDFSHNPYFNQLSCSDNELTFISLKNGTPQKYAVGTQIWSNNPNLVFVCIDSFDINALSHIIPENGLSNITNYNTYCTTTPGGDYNTIAGMMTFDSDNNGCDAADVPKPFLKIGIDDGSITGAAFLQNGGNYRFLTTAGTFILTPQIENGDAFMISPPTATVTFADANSNQAVENFCITPNGLQPDLEVVVFNLTAVTPGFDAGYEIIYRNKGNQTLSGSLNLDFDDDLTEYVSATVVPDGISTGNLNWNYVNLLPFESRIVKVIFHINSPTDTPAVSIGTLLTLKASILPVDNDESPLDNIYTRYSIASNSFDPNEIQCLEGDVLPLIQVGQYLHYIVYFENEGNAPAQKIVLKDDFNIKFDVKSLQLIGSSHPVEAHISSNRVEFVFDNINLAPGAKGNIIFKIRTKAELSAETTVTNKASIYFDYNFPVDTNTASTLFINLGTAAIDTSDNGLVIFPNPVKSNAVLQSKGLINLIELYDIQGRLLESKVLNAYQAEIDLAAKASGIYLLKVFTENRIKTQKLIKQ